MSRGKLSRTVLLLVLALVLVVVGVPDPAQAQRKDTVVIGLAQEPDLLIRAFSSMLVSGEVLTSLFVGMVDLDGQWKLVPQMAVKIPTLRDGDWELLPGKKMRVTYRLKKGYTWHDGRPVTALDVSWTYLMLRNPQSPTQSRFILKKIDNMLVPNPTDPHTLVVQWNELYPFANLGHATYPRHVLEREYLRDPSTLKAHRQARAPIGNGPYRFVEWSPGSHITLEAYDAYPGGKPKIRRQVWRFILDSTVLQANVIAGQVDVTGLANNFSIDQMADIERRSPQVTAHYSPDFIWERINLNLDNEWLKDRRVRAALAHAINRDELSTRLFYGKQPVAHTWVPERHEGHNPNVKKYAYDPARARDLLKEAGFAPGPDGILRDVSGKRVEMTIMTTAGNAVREQIQQIIKDQLRAVGIDLRIDNRPASVLVAQVIRRRQYTHMIMFATFYSPLTLPIGWHSDQIPSQANNWEGANSNGWRHPENDRLIDQIVEELDAVKRVQLMRRQQEIWAEELPSIPLYFRMSLTTSKKGLRNIKPGPWVNWNSEMWEWAQ